MKDKEENAEGEIEQVFLKRPADKLLGILVYASSKSRW